MVVGYAVDKEWSFEIKNLGLVRISSSLLTRLRSYRQLTPSAPEAGGVLIGMYLNSGGALLINELTPLQQTDKQGRHAYYRSKSHHALVRGLWKKSKHHSTYVGLWHSHPEPVPTFSPTDKTDWLNAINHSKYEGNKLFFFIVGQTHVRAWLGTKKRFGRKIERIGEYKFDD